LQLAESQLAESQITELQIPPDPSDRRSQMITDCGAFRCVLHTSTATAPQRKQAKLGVSAKKIEQLLQLQQTSLTTQELAG
jgi:hypothetical protein